MEITKLGRKKTKKKKLLLTKYILGACLSGFIPQHALNVTYMYATCQYILYVYIYIYIYICIYDINLTCHGPWAMTDSIYKLHMGNKGLHMTLCLFSGEPLEWEQSASFLFTSIGRWCTPFCGRICCPLTTSGMLHDLGCR